MKFKLALPADIGLNELDPEVIDGLERLGFVVRDVVDGAAEQGPGVRQPEIEILDLDMFAQFTETWGWVRVCGDQLVILDPAHAADSTAARWR